MELDDLPGLIISRIAALRFRPLQVFQLNEFVFVSGEFPRGFQFRPDFPRHPLAFRMSWRNDQGRLARFHGRSVIRRQRLMPLVSIHFPQHSELVQSLEGIFQIAARRSATTALCASPFAARFLLIRQRAGWRVFPRGGARRPRSTARCCGSVTGKNDPAVFLLARSATRASVRTLKSPASSFQMACPRTCACSFCFAAMPHRFRVGESRIRPQHPARRSADGAKVKTFAPPDLMQRPPLSSSLSCPCQPAANGRDALRALQDVPDGVALFIG